MFSHRTSLLGANGSVRSPITRRLVLNKKNYLVSLIICLVFAAFSPMMFAQSEYDSLPKLDGRRDTSVKDMKDLPPLDIPPPPTKNKVYPDQYLHTPDREVATVEETRPSSEIDVLTPTPKIKGPFLPDSLGYNVYEKDLETIMAQLEDLKKSTEQGVTLQEFSAKATTTKFRNDLFKNKYADKNESNYESYKLVQQMVQAAVFTRDYWRQANKLSYNMRGMKDQIVQSKFYEIGICYDKLLELGTTKDVLTEE